MHCDVDVLALPAWKFAQKERKSKKEKITGLDEHLADRRRSQKHLCQQNSIRFHHNSITRTYNSSQGEKIHSIKTRSKIKYTDRKRDSNQVMNRKNDDDLFEANRDIMREKHREILESVRNTRPNEVN